MTAAFPSAEQIAKVMLQGCITTCQELARHSGSGMPRDGPGFDSRWERCKNPASRPSQGTVNGGAIS